MSTLVVALHALVILADPTPKGEDVKAGWGAFAIFLALAVAVGLLCWSMYRHLRKTQANAEAGVFGEDPPKEP